MVEVLADRVGGALIPRLLIASLLGSEDVNEPAAEAVELVRLLDMLVQGCRVKLRQDEDLIKPRIQAITDRDVDQAVVTRQRHRRLAAILGQRVKAGTAAAAHDNTDDSRKGVHSRRDADSLAPQGNLLKRKGRMAA